MIGAIKRLVSTLARCDDIRFAIKVASFRGREKGVNAIFHAAIASGIVFGLFFFWYFFPLPFVFGLFALCF